MGSIALTLPTEVGKPNLSEILKLVGLPSKADHKQPSAVVEGLVAAIGPIIDELVQRAMSARTAEDFGRIRLEVFPQYLAAMMALGNLVRITVPKEKIEQLSAEALSELEAEFRNHGAATFGADLRDRGLFTIWTLRKINDLAQEISNIPVVAEPGNGVDAKMAMNFALHAVWTRFHVDGLVKAMQTHKPVYPEVVEPIRDGLRAAVDAYAWLRQSVDSCIGNKEPKIDPVNWDEDDELLLADSMRDMEQHEPI